MLPLHPAPAPPPRVTWPIRHLEIGQAFTVPLYGPGTLTDRSGRSIAQIRALVAYYRRATGRTFACNATADRVVISRLA